MKLLGKSLYTVFTVLGLVSLSACVGNSSNNQNNSVPTVVNSSVIIDPMSSVPVLNGTGTQGTLYIHNYTNQAVSGLDFSLNQPTFTSQVKGLIAKAGISFARSIEDKNGFVLLNPEYCTEIAANSSCAINFTTPNLSFANQGSALVNVSYKLNNKSITNSQVVNYNYIDGNSSTGVNFTGNVDVSGISGTTKYIVGYLYGSNSNSGVYKNVNLVSSSPTTTISGGFINSQEVAPNQVIAVEYSVAVQNNQKSYIQITPTWSNTISSISRSNVSGNSGLILGISVDPKQNAANYVFGNAPILNAAPNNTVTISVVNNGNANGSAITANKTGGNTAGITVDTSDCTAGKLQANANGTCSITYMVDTYTPGSTTVEYKDGSGTVVGSQMVYWTNKTPFPAVAAYSSIKNVVIAKESDSEILQFNFMNTGNAPLDNMLITPVVTGPVVWVQTENTCTTIMGVEGGCYIKGYLNPNDDGVGTIYFATTGNYDSQVYDFVSLPVRYMVVAAPNVVVTPANQISVTVLANNESSVTNMYVVQNIGNDPALITNMNLSAMTNLHKPEIAVNSTCNGRAILVENESCTVIITYGPELSNISINESGSMHIVVDYHGGTPDTSFTTTSESYIYSLVGNDTYAKESIVVSGFNSGTGTGGNPYKATALSESAQIKVTYSNPSVNYPLTNFNLNTNNLPYGMKIISTDCPTGSNLATLAKGASCEVIFGLNKELLKTSPQGGSTIYNFITPTVTWTTPLGFYTQAGTSNTLDYLQPAVSFSLSLNNGKFESTILTAMLSNASSGVSPFIANVSGVSGWLESSPIALSNNCTVDQSYAVSCSLSSGINESASIRYIMPTYAQADEIATIPLFYSTTNLGFLSPTYSLIRYFYTLTWINVGESGFSESTANYTNLAFNPSDSNPYVLYQDGANQNKATVMKFNGESWINVGESGFSESLAVTSGIVFNPSNNSPYVLYEDAAHENKLTVMTLNGNNWESVGGAGFTVTPSTGSQSLALNPSDNSPYIAYQSLNNGKISVMRFNGTNWDVVGNPNLASGGYIAIAFNPSNNVPYIVYQDSVNGNNTVVMKLNGVVWERVGEVLSTNGAENQSLAFDPRDNSPYVAYSDFAYGNQTTVKRFNGSSWTLVGKAGFSPGATYQDLAFNPRDGKPYIVYRTVNGTGNKATVMKFNGSAWVDVGSADFSTGSANYTKLAFNPSNNRPYVAYQDGAKSNKATVMEYK